MSAAKEGSPCLFKLHLVQRISRIIKDEVFCPAAEWAAQPACEGNCESAFSDPSRKVQAFQDGSNRGSATLAKSRRNHGVGPGVD